MRTLVTCLVVLLLAATSPALASSSWKGTKNVADDIVYAGKDRTFYCGCVYTSHDDGNGDVDHQACGYQIAEKWQHVANSIQWEHIVPASLMPARDLDCWALAGREKCEREDPRAQGMLFDLHNLAPSTASPPIPSERVPGSRPRMISDLDVYRSAQLLVERHGDGAPIEAAMKADAVLGKGDIDGRAARVSILRAV